MTSNTNDDVTTALADIIVILNSYGDSMPKTEIKSRMSSDTVKKFDEARKRGLRNGEIYVTVRGLISKIHVNKLSIEDRIAHIKYSLRLHEFAARQYLQDRPLLLSVPNFLKKLSESSNIDQKDYGRIVVEISQEALGMRDTLRDLSNTYAELEENLQSLVPKNFIPANLPRCKKCGSHRVRIVGKNKDTTICEACGEAT